MLGKSKKSYSNQISERYCITGVIGKGAMGVVYKAFPFDDPSDIVAVKVIESSRKMDTEHIIRFQKEAAVMSRLHHPNIISFHELGLIEDEDTGQDQTGYYIVMEYANGYDLKDILERDTRKDLNFFFEVGIQVAAALDYTHGKNIIHRDIKSQNIIVGRPFNQSILIKVLDYGVARLAENVVSTVDGEEHKKQDEAAGTPLYMAPEQSRHLDAPVDHRVDLYSLGCLLYETLTGRTPFTGKTREKLEKQHAHKQPEPLTSLRPDIPKAIEDIVHKLLAKHPDDRYQSAFGLRADLLKAKTEFERLARKSIPSFPLGLKDRFPAVSAQITMIGRDAEVQHVLDQYKKVSNERARSRMTVIKGPHGVGKSRLIRGVRQAFQERGIRFLSGSFSQHETSIPLNALANAFNEYLFDLMRRSPFEAQSLQKRFNTVLGSMGARIANIVPGLKSYIQVDETTLDAHEDGSALNSLPEDPEDFNRFSKLFSDFTRCLVPDNQALVFFFDDMHWADETSLALIDRFFVLNNAQRFYLVISYSSGYEDERPALGEFLSKCARLKRRYSELQLAPLDRDHVLGVVQHMLGQGSSIDQKLLSLVNERTQGLPMYIVELVRTLVAEDLVQEGHTGLWKLTDSDEAVAKFQVTSIDVVLSRLKKLDDTTLIVLSLASVSGLSFEAEVLSMPQMRDQQIPPEVVQATLNEAIDAGFLFRINEFAVSDNPHGGTVLLHRFVHKKIRDALYKKISLLRRSQWHAMLAARLEQLNPTPSAGMIFRISHHLNMALTGASDKDRPLLERCLSFNQRAADAASASEAWVSAEKYLERAAQLVEIVQPPLTTKTEEIKILEKLGDLAILKREHNVALDKYQELLVRGLDPVTYGRVAHKVLYFQMVGGVIAGARALLSKTLGYLGHTEPAIDWLSRIRLLVYYGLDLLPRMREWKPSRLILKATYLRSKRRAKHQRQEDIDSFPAIKVFQVGQWLYLSDDRAMAYQYHHRAFLEAKSQRSSPEVVVCLMAERASFMAMQGHITSAYELFELASQIAKALRLKSAYGYAILMRVLCLEQPRSRMEEASDKLKRALDTVSREDYRLAFAMGMQFRVFLELQRCRFDRIPLFLNKLPRVVPARSWVRPRVTAMSMFGHLLQNTRDQMLQKGESFLKRREAVGARSDDLHLLLVSTMVHFARGDVERTRRSFKYTLRAYVLTLQKGLLLPFEEDFVSLAIVVLPDLFSQEYGHRLMRDNDMVLMVKHMAKRLKQRKHANKSYTDLMRARIADIVGDPEARAFYYKALDASKAENNTMNIAFAYYWLAAHLARRKDSSALDVINRGITYCTRLGLAGLFGHMAKVARKYFKVNLAPDKVFDQQKAGKDRSQLQGQSNVSLLILHHLTYFSTPKETGVDLQHQLEHAFSLLKKSYLAKRIGFLQWDDEDRMNILWQQHITADQRDSLARYLLPYLNLRSTLLLPSKDAPWAQPGASKGDTRQNLDESVKTEQHPTARQPSAHTNPEAEVPTAELYAQDSSEHPIDYGEDATVVEAQLQAGQEPSSHELRLEEADLSATGVVDRARTERNQTIRSGDRRQHAPDVRSTNLNMSAIVPTQGSGGKGGLIYIENIVDQHNRDSVHARYELDRFGAQIGWIMQQAESSASASERPPGSRPQAFASGVYSLEPCPWLYFEAIGKMRQKREVSYYQGMQVSDEQYFLAYVLVQGEERVSHLVGRMLWNHAQTLRGFARITGQSLMELAEIREDCSGIIKHCSETYELNNISMAFSLFNRTRSSVISGHFGRARPVVLGMENQLNAYNEVIARLPNGRDIRYWETEALIDVRHPYVLSYDTSRLDGVIKPGSTFGSRYSLVEEKQHGNSIHQLVQKWVAEEHLPRYYLAIAMMPEAGLAADQGGGSDHTLGATSTQKAATLEVQSVGEPEQRAAAEDTEATDGSENKQLGDTTQAS